MEKDDEVKGASGSSYDFGARMYDPRVGRFLSLDPLARKFSWQSPYAFAMNSPLRLIDKDGKEGWDSFVETATETGKSALVLYNQYEAKITAVAITVSGVAITATGMGLSTTGSGSVIGVPLMMYGLGQTAYGIAKTTNEFTGAKHQALNNSNNLPQMIGNGFEKVGAPEWTGEASYYLGEAFGLIGGIIGSAKTLLNPTIYRDIAAGKKVLLNTFKVYWSQTKLASKTSSLVNLTVQAAYDSFQEDAKLRLSNITSFQQKVEVVEHLSGYSFNIQWQAVDDQGNVFARSQQINVDTGVQQEDCNDSCSEVEQCSSTTDSCY